MATMLADKGTHWEVSTVSSLGRRSNIPRGMVVVEKGDRDARKAEMVRQALQARRDAGVEVEQTGPVV